MWFSVTPRIWETIWNVVCLRSMGKEYQYVRYLSETASRYHIHLIEKFIAMWIVYGQYERNVNVLDI